MKINDLVNIFKKRNETSRDKLLKLYLDEISNYIMFEQTLIKKDNGPSPIIKYRYENTIMLVINSWELILKAFIRKYMRKSIFLENGHTIPFTDCLDYFKKYVNQNKLGDKYLVLIKNLELINEYRNNIMHFYNETSMEPIIFSLLTKKTVHL